MINIWLTFNAQLERTPNGEANGIENGNHSVKLTSFKNYEVEPTELHHILPGKSSSKQHCMM